MASFAARAPQIVRWDDHEVVNVAGDRRSKGLTVHLRDHNGDSLCSETLAPEGGA